MSEGFVGNADIFMLFFWLCKRYSINTEPERVALLRRLTAAKRLKYVRDSEKYMKGKSVVKIVHKGA